MNPNQKIPTREELINYAYGLLSPERSQEIETLIQQDDILQDEYEVILWMMEQYPERDVEEVIEERIAAIRYRPEQEQSSLGVSFKKYFWAAAAIIVLVVGGYFISTNLHSASDSNLTALLEKELKKPASSDILSRGNEVDISWKEKIRGGEYVSALEDLRKEDQGAADILFFIGWSFLKSEPIQKDSAILYLRKCEALNSLGYTSESRYFLGIAYAARGNYEDARNAFSLVTGKLQPDAQAFLDLLK